MNTPICDFVNNYIKSSAVRLHMPGHKGRCILGPEAMDITEISEADSLYEADGIIGESEKNASSLFGAHTFYSAEGSSLSIRAMVYLVRLYALKYGRPAIIAAGRNAHKSFVSAAALSGVGVKWIYGDFEDGYLACKINPDALDKQLSETEVSAVYVTSPDYPGNISDIKRISEICRKHNCLCLVDNAHGAYLKFLGKSQHPIDLGADFCCDSAHKTLPVLTGGAYLHISKNAPEFFRENAKQAMALFGSTSPSYLVLQSLDAVNSYIYNGYRQKLSVFLEKASELKQALAEMGYTIVNDEPLKLTISTKDYGYRGYELADLLRDKNIECEFSDPDFVVLMLTPEVSDDELKALEMAFSDIEKRKAVPEKPPVFTKPSKMLEIRDAVLSVHESVDVELSVGRIAACVTVGCPPAVPVVVSGELIDESVVECLKYYGIKKIEVVVM